MLGDDIQIYKQGRFPIRKGFVVIPDFDFDYIPPSLRVTVIMPQFLFDYSQVIVDISEKQIGSALSNKQVAEQIGIPINAFLRIMDSHEYDMQTFVKILNWLGNNPARYFRIKEMKRTQEKMRGRYEERINSTTYAQEAALTDRAKDGLYGEHDHPLIKKRKKCWLKPQYEPKPKEKNK